jgi:hypothetical protein
MGDITLTAALFPVCRPLAAQNEGCLGFIGDRLVEITGHFRNAL